MIKEPSYDLASASCEELIFFLKDLNEFDSTEGEFELRNLFMIQTANNFSIPNSHSLTADPKYICAVGSCKKNFKTKLRYDKHTQKHFCEKRFKCESEHCGKIYKSKENLTLHIKNKHLNVRPYVCMYCTQSFSHRNGKIYHERKVHKDKMSYNCNVGGRFLLI
jgi:hypothetical protein